MRLAVVGLTRSGAQVCRRIRTGLIAKGWRASVEQEAESQGIRTGAETEVTNNLSEEAAVKRDKVWTAVGQNRQREEARCGRRLAENGSQRVDLFLKAELGLAAGEQPIGRPFRQFVGELFVGYDGLIFVMATGIVVRSIAPFLENKQIDPAVVVLDDLGRHVIPLLSGHLGGANRLAGQLAALLDAQPVITTATDLHHVPAFDLIAQEHGMKIERLENLKQISGSLIDGGQIGIFTDLPLGQELSQESPLIQMVGQGDELERISRAGRAELIRNYRGVVLMTEQLVAEEVLAGLDLPILILRPKNLVLGLGFRRGKSRQELREAVEKACQLARVSIFSIGKIMTIDLKGDEPGLAELREELQLPVEIFSRQQVGEVEEFFPSSEFVKKTIGVGAVAEPCAYLGSPEGEWVLRKVALAGVTVAIRKVNYEGRQV